MFQKHVHYSMWPITLHGFFLEEKASNSQTNNYQYLGFFFTIMSVLTEIKLYCPNPAWVWGIFCQCGFFPPLFLKGTFWTVLVYAHLHAFTEFKITKYLFSKNALKKKRSVGAWLTLTDELWWVSLGYGPDTHPAAHSWPPWRGGGGEQDQKACELR